MPRAERRGDHLTQSSFHLNRLDLATRAQLVVRILETIVDIRGPFDHAERVGVQQLPGTRVAAIADEAGPFASALPVSPANGLAFGIKLPGAAGAVPMHTPFLP